MSESRSKLAIIAGGRDYENLARVKEVILEEGVTFIINGGARGADEQARIAAELLGIDYMTIPALWGSRGKAAGPRRNKLMAKILVLIGVNRNYCLLAFPGGSGTAGMVKEAEAAGIPVQKVDW